MQVPVSIGFIFAEYASLSFNPHTRWDVALEQLQRINGSFHPEIASWQDATTEQMQAAALEAGLRSEDEPDTTYYTAAIYLLAAHLLGVIHNRKLHSNLFNHANLLYEHGENMETISEEVVNCQLLLENIFPQEVLERLKQRDDGDRHAAVLAEEFNGCTFLFAKVVGLKQLTEDEERDPADVINVLQLIFDQFDLLADTFKVQKVRKTVNEYYMVAAGLPDPSVLVEPKERALAITALAFSMVHVMDIINADATMRELGLHLDTQIGIHTGDA